MNSLNIFFFIIDQFSIVDACSGPNEEFNYCGPHIEPTCANRHPPTYFICRKGCFCKSGYIRNNDNHCIPESAC